MWKLAKANRAAVGRLGLACALAMAFLPAAGCSTVPTEAVYEHRAQLNSLPVYVGEMCYLDIGPRDGPVVLLVHGLPTSSWIYRHIAYDLAERGFRVIAPDLPGFGASDKPCDADTYRADLQAARLFTLMDFLGIDVWTQVCHDLGGFWTWEMLADQPERIEKLVILNTTAYRSGFHHRRAVQVALLDGPLGPLLLRLLRHPHMGPHVLKFAMHRFIGDPDLLTDTVLAGYWLPLHEGADFPLHVFANSLDQHLADLPRYADAVRHSGIPAMIIWGAEDPVMNVRRIPQQFVVDLAIPPERVIILPDAGHFLMEDEPFVLSEHIAAFASTPASTLR